MQADVHEVGPRELFFFSEKQMLATTISIDGNDDNDDDNGDDHIDDNNDGYGEV